MIAGLPGLPADNDLNLDFVLKIQMTTPDCCESFRLLALFEIEGEVDFWQPFSALRRAWVLFIFSRS